MRLALMDDARQSKNAHMLRARAPQSRHTLPTGRARGHNIINQNDRAIFNRSLLFRGAVKNARDIAAPLGAAQACLGACVSASQKEIGKIAHAALA